MFERKTLPDLVETLRAVPGMGTRTARAIRWAVREAPADYGAARGVAMLRDFGDYDTHVESGFLNLGESRETVVGASMMRRC
jgi:hypothetical protein